jgi:protease II
MADTQRSRAQILSLFADNVTGQISAQDLRDYVVTVMESEFVNAGDFWAKPAVAYTTTDKTARGAKLYSQYIGSDCSWMNVMFMEASTGYWMRADVADSTKNGFIGLAMDSYTSDLSTGVILIEGMVYDSSFSTVFSELVGRPVYLDSGVPGSVSIGETQNSVLIIGWIMHSDDHGGSAIGKWYFSGQGAWSIKGS